MKYDWLDRKAAAKRIGTSVRTLDRWRADGLYLPYTKVAGRVKYTPENCDELVERNTRKVACG